MCFRRLTFTAALAATALFCGGPAALRAQTSTTAEVRPALHPGSVTSSTVVRAEPSMSPDDTRKWGNQLGMDLGFLQENIDRLMAEAIAAGDIPGGVVLVSRYDSTNKQFVRAHFSAYGNRAVAPEVEPATVDTIYDLASLTKPIATATSIMKLVEQGKIRLSDPVAKFIPEWMNNDAETSQKVLLKNLEQAIEAGQVQGCLNAANESDAKTVSLLKTVRETFPDIESAGSIKAGLILLPRDRESITIRHLLTHTSGLPSFQRYYEKYPEGHARKQIVSDIAAVKLNGPVGGQFIYSDLGFIILGEIVERVSGIPLDDFSSSHIFAPLQMAETAFNPSPGKRVRVAPTEWRASQAGDPDTTRTMIRGHVHDGNALVQDGVSGHAGLFSTAWDVSLFCDMMLRGGLSASSERILSPVTVAAMTTDHAALSHQKVRRGLGWDIESPYDSEKGEIFSTGYGHTGFTGTSVWIVPEEKLSVIILTNRVHPDGEGNTTPLRARIANVVAGSITRSYNEKPLENRSHE